MYSWKLVIEVLSDSTESFDRGEKFRSYRQISSLQEYILVSQNDALIEQFYRDKTGRWQFGEVVAEGILTLETVPFVLEITKIYRNIVFKSKAAKAETDENS